MPFTTSDYIITRLAQQNVEAIFGVPAVYCAPVFEAAANTANFRVVVTSSDLVAGYAADGYARTLGLSAVSVAYGVGTLSLLNAVAGAYIERSPVVVINGGPSQARIDQQNNTGILFSHSMGQPHSNGLYGYEQYLLKRSYYANSTEPPLPYTVLARWDYVATAKAMGVSFARTADAIASLRTALAAAKAFNAGPALIHAVVQSRSLPSAT
jgi:thiamine pyrophosphate-dependent acetolactate synthase large subunit-like protein